MKRIKFFFIRNYQRFLRFLMSFSAIGCILVSSFSVFAYDSQPDVKLSSIDYGILNYGVPLIERKQPATYWGYTSSFAPYISEVMSGTTQGNTFPTPYYSYSSCAALNSLYDVNGSKMFAPNSYVVRQSISFSKKVARASFFIKLGAGFVFDTDNATVQNMGSNTDFSVWYSGWQDWAKAYEVVVYNCDSFKLSTYVKNSSNISTLGYMVSLSSVQFVDGTSLIIESNNQNTDKIVSAIESNKSSAEKEQYSGATTEQKQAQSDLDTSEKKISDDTAEARSTTINIFKNFSVVGDISKGLLSVTALFNDLCLRFSPSAGLLNFSLALGIGAFLLGVSAYVISKVIHRGGK